MGIFGHRNKQGKLNLRKTYTLGEVMEFVSDEKYEQYEFMPVDPENLQAGYRPVGKEEVRSCIEDIKRSKRNPEFEKYVTGNGSYKNIDREINRNVYNSYQNAKNYSPREVGLR